jgi:hypothetical protein
MTKEQDNSKAWFIGKARSAAGYRRNIVNNSERARDGAVIGKMYFFAYDPKTKDTLPMYDKFPLVFPIEKYPNGFLGINLHYLSTPERRVLLTRLMDYKTNQRMDAKTKLRLSYDLLMSVKKIKGPASRCIKRYLFSHTRSRFIEITADEWFNAIDLPVDQFVYNR